MAALVSDPGRAGDVIVAPATPPGVSALAVVRLTGPPGRTLEVARRLAPALGEAPESRRVRRSALLDGEGRTLDDALVLYFAAPGSATGEEVVELFCHGSPAIVAGLLDAARRAGARPAAPGEFTRRALANGKLDLAAAEGLPRLAAAESRGAARRALGLVQGGLSRRIDSVRENLLDLLAELEGGLDFAGEVEVRPERVAAELREVRDELARLAALASAGGARERTPAVAILGRPNAGKSTLFNALLGSDRAIVTAVPGTTRDAIAETIELSGERVRLLDTAGLRETEHEVERIGVDVARRAGAGADLVLYAIDGTAPMSPEDRAFLEGSERDRTVFVSTKADLPGDGASGADAVVSAATGAGLEALRRLVAGRLGLVESGGELLVLERHREALERGAGAAGEAAALAERREGEELVAAAIRKALAALGDITGETATEELLDRIFSTFCLGK